MAKLYSPEQIIWLIAESFLITGVACGLSPKSMKTIKIYVIFGSLTL